MKPKHRRLTAEHLEDRTVPAPWPFNPTNQAWPVGATYGQYLEGGDLGIHFHEGLDITAPAGTAVLAVEAGTIAGVYDNLVVPMQSFIAIDTGGGNGWNYLHITIGNKPAANAPVTAAPRKWQIGDTVNLGDQLGTVVPPGGTGTAHLHLDRGGGEDESLATHPTPEIRKMRKSVADPLALVEPLTDTIDPTVDPIIHFRVQEHDRNGTTAPPPSNYIGSAELSRRDNQYFDKVKNGNLLVGHFATTKNLDNQAGTTEDRTNIDIIANIFDKVSDSQVSDIVGVKQVYFSITGKTHGGASGEIEAFDFSGKFLQYQTAHGGGAVDLRDQFFIAFRDLDLVRTVYENDQYSNSTNSTKFWYTATNTDKTPTAGNQLVDRNDRAKYWNSNVPKDSAWNDTANATENAKAKFPDDFYTVKVWAYDANENMGENEIKILLANFERVVGLGQNIYTPGQNVTVTSGSGFVSNQSVGYHVLTQMPTDGGNLTNLVATGTSDVDGHLNQTILSGVTTSPGSYWVVADYDNDGVFTPELDGLTTFAVSGSGGSGGSGTIGNFVWLDVDQDGVQDTGETTGVSGAAITLKDAAGNILGNTVSNSGFYAFGGLGAGTYQVVFVPPAGYTLTTPATHIVTIGAGQTYNLADAGVHGSGGSGGSGGTIGDFVWLDVDQDGVQDTGETTGVSGAAITLKDEAGNILGNTVSNSGSYAFGGLGAGTYQVVFVPPAGYTLTTPATHIVNLGAGQIYYLADAGVHGSGGSGGSGTIGNFVWLDVDQDGVQDTGETTGVSGAAITLKDAAGNILGNTVSNSGFYAFGGLGAGTYQVVFVPPAGYTLTTPATHIVTIGAGQTYNLADAGVHGSGGSGGSGGFGSSPMGSTWDDTDAEGGRDQGDTGSSQVAVYLFDTDEMQIGTTDSSLGVTSPDRLDGRPDRSRFVLWDGYEFKSKWYGDDNTADDAYVLGSTPSALGDTDLMDLMPGPLATDIEAGLHWGGAGLPGI